MPERFVPAAAGRLEMVALGEDWRLRGDDDDGIGFFSNGVAFVVALGAGLEAGRSSSSSSSKRSSPSSSSSESERNVARSSYSYTAREWYGTRGVGRYTGWAALRTSLTIAAGALWSLVSPFEALDGRERAP